MSIRSPESGSGTRYQLHCGMRDWAVDAFTIIVGLNEVRKVEVFSCEFLCEGVFREVEKVCIVGLSEVRKVEVFSCKFLCEGVFRESVEKVCDWKSLSFRICTVSSGIVKTS